MNKLQGPARLVRRSYFVPSLAVVLECGHTRFVHGRRARTLVRAEIMHCDQCPGTEPSPGVIAFRRALHATMSRVRRAKKRAGIPLRKRPHVKPVKPVKPDAPTTPFTTPPGAPVGGDEL